MLYMQHEDKNFLLPDESNEGTAEVRDRTVEDAMVPVKYFVSNPEEDTMVVTVPVKWHT